MFESHFVDKLVHKAFVPDPASLLLAMDVAMDLWDTLFAVGSLNIKAFRDLHADVPLRRSLWKGQHMINLCGVKISPGMLESAELISASIV